jgi:hypothetical protein
VLAIFGVGAALLAWFNGTSVATAAMRLVVYGALSRLVVHPLLRRFRSEE